MATNPAEPAESVSFGASHRRPTPAAWATSDA